MNVSTTSRFVVLITVPALVLGACGKKDDAPKVATQVAAKVNATEITVHQINHALARSGGFTPENASQAKQEILDRLINQELAKRQAILKGLDRSPNVLLDLEAAKSEILARAYRESLVDHLPKPAPYDVETYYRRNPELFAQRRIFSLDELNFTDTKGVAAEVRELVSRSRSLKDVAGWLQSRGIAYAVNRSVRAAEDLPLEILPKLQLMKEGESQLFAAGGSRFRVIRVVGFQAAPIDEVTATPRIQQFLFNRNSIEVIAKEMKDTRNLAKIEYFGEFAKPTAEGEAKAAAESEVLQTLEKLPKGQPKN